MTVMAMEVISAEKHPNADALRLMKMKVPEKEAVQIIANLDNIYQIGDIVAIALAGSVLKDGTKIKPTKLRGLYSYGMALGKVGGNAAWQAAYSTPTQGVDAEVGQDLSNIYLKKLLAFSF